jgi:hypothetical protein
MREQRAAVPSATTASTGRKAGLRAALSNSFALGALRADHPEDNVTSVRGVAYNIESAMNRIRFLIVVGFAVGTIRAAGDPRIVQQGLQFTF